MDRLVERDGRAQVLSEDDGGKGDPTGLPHGHPYPGEEETEELRIAGPEILLNASIPGYGQSELDEGGGSCPDQDTCQKPHRDSDAGRCDMVAYLRRGREYARAYLEAEDESDAIDKRQ